MGQISNKLRSAMTNRGAGVGFYCPGCKEMHAISTGGSGWTWDGNVDAPTFSPSVKVTYSGITKDGLPEETCCHFFVRAGRIDFLGDCTHELRGQNVPLPDLPADLKDP